MCYTAFLAAPVTESDLVSWQCAKKRLRHPRGLISDFENDALEARGAESVVI